MRSYANLRWAVLLASLFTSSSTAAAADSLDYLATVKAYADAMIEHGRDRYGSEPSPLFAGALDRKNLDLPEGKVPGIPGIRSHDRAVSGSNPMHHETTSASTLAPLVVVRLKHASWDRHSRSPD